MKQVGGHSAKIHVIVYAELGNSIIDKVALGILVVARKLLAVEVEGVLEVFMAVEMASVYVIRLTLVARKTLQTSNFVLVIDAIRKKLDECFGNTALPANEKTDRRV